MLLLAAAAGPALPAAQGLPLGAGRGDVVAALREARLSVTEPAKNVLRFEGSRDEGVARSAAYTLLTFDVDDALAVVEAHFPSDGAASDPRRLSDAFDRLGRALTRSLGRPRRSGTRDFWWGRGRVAIRLYEPGTGERGIVLRHEVQGSWILK